MSLQLKGIINKMKQTLKMQFIYLRSFLSFFIAIDSLNFVGNVEFKNIIRDLSCSICVKKINLHILKPTRLSLGSFALL